MHHTQCLTAGGDRTKDVEGGITSESEDSDEESTDDESGEVGSNSGGCTRQKTPHETQESHEPTTEPGKTYKRCFRT